MEEINQQSETLDSIIQDFVSEVTGLAKSLPFVMYTIHARTKAIVDDIGKFLEMHGIKTGEESGSVEYSMSGLGFFTLDAKMKNSEMAAKSLEIIPRSFVVSLVSSYDGFLSRLLKYLLLQEPGLLSGSEQTLNFYLLDQFETIQHAKEFIAEKEVEKVLRDSHSDQFKWIEKNSKSLWNQI